MTDIKVNEHGVNKLIKAHLLSDKQMREIGFTDCRKGYWYFCRIFKGFKSDRKFTNEISFNVSISKNNTLDLSIDILDEDFCQPYDYQSMLDKNTTFAPALMVRDFVEEWMKYLQENEILSGHIIGEYI